MRATGALKQILQDAIDVSDYDEIDAVCVVDGVEGSSTGLGVRVITGMQKESETGWVPFVTFTAASLTTVGSADVQNGSVKLLKYVRWEVTGIGGATAMVFDIGGMLRRRS